MKLLPTIAGLFFVASVAGRGHAAGAGRPRLGPEHKASVELATTASLAPSTADVRASHLAETLSAGLRLQPRLVLTLDATLAFTSFRARGRERRTSTRLGNPLLAAHLTLLERPQHRLELGFGTAPPLVTAPGGLDANSAATFSDRVAWEARGTQAPWLWSNNAVPLVVLASLETRLSRRFHARMEAQPAYLLSVNRRPSRIGLDSTVRLGLHAGAWHPELAVHIYAQSVPIRDGDYAQLSVAPALRYEQPGWCAGGELAVNLDGPAGFGEANRTPWGVTLGGGMRF